ncbi:acyl carrier protein [Clostridium felsineum]|uniref:acyl carrier protein n=1 Tax=Clostridium felsineum TaxID=36839 RepID=UPI00214DB7EC|nr:acyl carrier protein [Clostridium felsineum]MCR3761671.1 acyl carrier protein [Clostridium felsineum]
MEEKIINIICNALGNNDNRDSILKSKDLAEFGFNSLNFIKIIVKLEDEFDIEFSDNELNCSNYNSVYKILNLVKSKIDAN